MAERWSAVDFDLTDRVVVVTGAGRGIGRAIACAFRRCNARVVATTRTAASAHALMADDASSDVLVLDMTLPDAGERIAARVGDSGDQLHALVNNVGEVVQRAPALQWNAEQWNRALAANLTSAFQTSQALFPLLQRGTGSIVNVASMLSFTGGLNSVGYAAAKGGVAQLTKALSNEWAGAGVRVNAVAPGYISTDANADLRAVDDRVRQLTERIPAGRWGEPEDVAGPVLFLTSDAARYVSGVVLPVDGGFLAW